MGQLAATGSGVTQKIKWVSKLNLLSYFITPSVLQPKHANQLHQCENETDDDFKLVDLVQQLLNFVQYQ